MGWKFRVEITNIATRPEACLGFFKQISGKFSQPFFLLASRYLLMKNVSKIPVNLCFTLYFKPNVKKLRKESFRWGKFLWRNIQNWNFCVLILIYWNYLIWGICWKFSLSLKWVTFPFETKGACHLNSFICCQRFSWKSCNKIKVRKQVSH